MITEFPWGKTIPIIFSLSFFVFFSPSLLMKTPTAMIQMFLLTFFCHVFKFIYLFIYETLRCQKEKQSLPSIDRYSKFFIKNSNLEIFFTGFYCYLTFTWLSKTFLILQEECCGPSISKSYRTWFSWGINQNNCPL